MGNAADSLREALQSLYAVDARIRLTRWRTPGAPMDDAGPEPWLVRQSASDALSEALEHEWVSELEHAQWLRHLNVIRARLRALPPWRQIRNAVDDCVLSTGERLDGPVHVARLLGGDDRRARAALADELESLLAPQAARALETAQRFDGALGVAVDPTPALQWLAATDDMAQDGMRHALRDAKTDWPPRWQEALHGVRAPQLNQYTAARDRWPRAAAPLLELGFGEILDRDVRAEQARGQPLAGAERICLQVPGDIRVALGVVDYGLCSDLSATQATANALCVALTSPSLSPELRWPLGGGVPDVAGSLFTQLWGDPAFQRHQCGHSPADADRVARHAALIVLLSSRLSAAVVAALGVPHRTRREALEALAEATSRATCARVPAVLPSLLLPGAVESQQRLEVQLTGLAMHCGLRESFDVDWYKNPRMAEVITGAAARGNTLDAAGWRAELGVDLSAASERMAELLP